MLKNSVNLLKSKFWHTQHYIIRTAVVMSVIALVACQSDATMHSKRIDTPVVESLSIKMLDMGYAPVKLDVAHTGRYQINVTNTSTVPHDIVFSNGVQLVVAPGKKASTVLDVPEAGLSYACSLPGHKEAGMVGSIVVNNEDPPAVKEVTADAGTKASKKTTENYKLHDPKVPSLQAGKVHDVYLIAEEKENVVAKGVSQQLWTYNGQVPGPVLHIRVGDTVRVHLENPKTNKLAHSVDFHASQVAWNDEMTSINPGEKKLYEWRADYAGVWMYHCGSNPALHHIASGMYGMVIVEPAEGLPKVDHEFAIVQSEFYLGKAGDITDLHKAGSHSPDYVVFNGVANQYKDHPIEVGTGKKVRMYVLNAGPNEDSSFHIVGTIFNRVIKEGMELVPENKGHYGSQAVDLAPAQGAIIEFTTAEDGLYPMVTHAFNYVGKGALGLIKAGDGDPKN
jgi:nitrite reductase (NO-forming)